MMWQELFTWPYSLGFQEVLKDVTSQIERRDLKADLLVDAWWGSSRLTRRTSWILQLTPRLLSGTFRGFQRLKLKHEKLLTNFAINCNLRHYTVVTEHDPRIDPFD